MQKFVVSLLFLLSSFVVAEKLTIYHFGVGQGDATLVVAEHNNGDFTTILLDVGNSSSKGRAIFEYMQNTLGSKYKRLDCLVVSHLHLDHYGGAIALLSEFEKHNWKVGVIVDKGTKPGQFLAMANALNDTCCQPDREDLFMDNDPIDEPDSIGIMGSKLDDYLNKVSKYKRKILAPGVDLLKIAKNVKTKMSMVCVTANVKILTQYGQKSVVDYEHLAHSENDYSYGFILQFEGFKYGTFGDLGGENPAYLDLETPFINYLRTWPIGQKDFHLCTLKVSHHGSPHSTNEEFSRYTKPTISVIQSALRSFSGTQLPSKKIIDRLSGLGSSMEYTYVPETNYWSGKVKAYKDVVIEVKNPGYYKNILMKVTTRVRDKSTLKWVEQGKTKLKLCGQKHAR